jgi:hypothetical protein
VSLCRDGGWIGQRAALDCQPSRFSMACNVYVSRATCHVAGRSAPHGVGVLVLLCLFQATTLMSIAPAEIDRCDSRPRRFYFLLTITPRYAASRAPRCHAAFKACTLLALA